VSGREERTEKKTEGEGENGRSKMVGEDGLDGRRNEEWRKMVDDVVRFVNVVSLGYMKCVIRTSCYN
jgi:hypothetical protein